MSHAMSCLVRSLAEGRYYPIRTYFTASLLIPLGKKDGGTRPIAVESLWLRLASHAVLLVARGPVNAAISPRQFGVGLGTERAVHALAAMVAARPADAFALLDFRNAFNSVSRGHLLQRLYGRPELRALWGIADLCYSSPAPLLVFERGSLCATLSSEQGVRQGSVLGPFLFALAIDEQLASLGAEVIAYLDDITVGCAPSSVPAVLRHAEAVFAPLGLVLNRSKTTILCASPLPDGLASSLSGVALSSDFVRGLGAPIGWDTAAMQLYVSRAAEKHRTFFSRLAQLHPVLATRLLAVCGVPRFTFLARVCTPTISAPGAAIFDAFVVSALHSILRRPLSPDELSLACFPVRLGGLGARLFAPILQICYDNSVADHTHGQHDDTLEREVALHADLIARYPAAAPLLRASQGRGANLWLAAPGSGDCPKTLPAADASRAFLSMRVGIVAPAPPQPLYCKCGRPVPDSDVAGLHLFSCRHISRTGLHDAVGRTLRKELQAIGLACTDDLSRFRGACHERPDLLVQLSAGTVALDVTIVHPASAAYRSLLSPGSAAGAAEATKCNDSVALCALVGCAFSPFALESWGAIGPKSFAFLSRAGAERLPPDAVPSWRNHVIAACQAAYVDAFGSALAAARFSFSSLVFPGSASSPSALAVPGSAGGDEQLLALFSSPISSSRSAPALVSSTLAMPSSEPSRVLPDPDFCVPSRFAASVLPSSFVPSLLSSRVSTSPPPLSSPRSVVISPQVECT